MHSRTTTAMLDELLDPANEVVWRDFVERYRPVLVSIGRRLGLGPEDAADAAQDTLARFVRAYRAGKYDRTRGRLSTWLIAIARRCIIDVHHAGAGRRERGLSAVGDLPDERELADLWRAECEREILRIAIERLRTETKSDERTIRIFELLVHHRREPASVAEELGVSRNDVYLAKHRTLERIRAIVERLEADWSDDAEPSS